MKRYKAKKGCRLKNADAQLIGETMERIGFSAPPQRLVDEARPKSSPIHHIFPWSDKEAAEAHRVFLARNFINHLEVIVITDQGERQEKAFHSVTITRGEESERGYVSLETIVDNRDLTDQVIDHALADARRFADRYKQFRNYPKLREIFDAIDRATKKTKKRPSARMPQKRRRIAIAGS